MKKYIVEAHLQNNEKKFRITFKAFSSNHACALFLSEMENRKLTVVIERLCGKPIVLSRRCFPNVVVLERVCAL